MAGLLYVGNPGLPLESSEVMWRGSKRGNVAPSRKGRRTLLINAVLFFYAAEGAIDAAAAASVTNTFIPSAFPPSFGV